jgi:DNA gyrase subunit A
LDLREGERVLEMVPYREEAVRDDHFIVTVTARGYVKRTQLSEFANIRTTGLIALSIEDDDQLIDVAFTDGKGDLMLNSANGMAIRFSEEEVRPMGRTARGVRGMGLREGDRVVGMSIIPSGSTQHVLTLCENGYGKLTPITEYRAQSRAGLGLITMKVNERNGKVVVSLLANRDEQVMIITSRGKVIRTPLSGISVLGRNTMGVRIMRLRDDERVVAATPVVESSDKDVEPDEMLVTMADQLAAAHPDEAPEEPSEDTGPEGGGAP